MTKILALLAMAASLNAAEINGVADLARVTTPAAAPASFIRLYGDSLTGTLKCLDASSANCFNVNLSGAAAPTLPATTTFYSIGASGANSRDLNLAYGGTAFFTNARLDGTPASPTALLADEQIGGYNAFGCGVAPCTTILGPVASMRTFAKTNWSVSNSDSYIDFTTTSTGSTTAVARGRIENDGGLLWPPTVTGGSQGPGSINAAALYINGVAVTAGAGGLTINSTPISGGGTNAILYGDGTKLQNATGVTRSAAGTFTFTTSVISPLYTGAGDIKFQPGANSTTAMQFANAAGTAFVTMDSTNQILAATGQITANVVTAQLLRADSSSNVFLSDSLGLFLSGSLPINWRSGVGGSADTGLFRSAAGSVGCGKGSATANCAFKAGTVQNLTASVTFSATPVFDLSAGDQSITLTGNVTSSTITNGTAGQLVTFYVCQDVAGARTFAWPTVLKGTAVVGVTPSTCSAQSFKSFDGATFYAITPGVTNQ